MSEVLVDLVSLLEVLLDLFEQVPSISSFSSSVRSFSRLVALLEVLVVFVQQVLRLSGFNSFVRSFGRSSSFA